MSIILEHDDARLGSYGPEGQVIWPSLDATGQEYVQVNATIQRLNATQFVVIPPNRWQEIEAVIVREAPPVLPVVEEVKAPEVEGVLSLPAVSPERMDEIATEFKKVVSAKRPQ